MALFHMTGEEDWNPTVPVTFVSASYSKMARGFRVLVQTPQVNQPSHVTPGELRLSWSTKMTLCTGPDCPFENCQVRKQLNAKEETPTRPKLVVPSQDGDFHLN